MEEDKDEHLDLLRIFFSELFGQTMAFLKEALSLERFQIEKKANY